MYRKEIIYEKFKNKRKEIEGSIKKGIVLTNIVFTLSSITACANQVPEDWPDEFLYVSQEDNNFEDFTKSVISDGKPTVVYSGKNIAIAINKETYEVGEYIFWEGAISGKIYDLKTGYLIVDISIATTYGDINVKNNDVILDNCYVVEFRNIGDYIEGEELKENYTLEEIQNLEPAIVEAVKKINEHNKKLVKE